MPGQRPRRMPLELAKTLLIYVDFRIVSRRQRPPVRSVSRLNPLAIVPPVYALYLTLRSCLQDSEPVWLAGPSPYGSCIRYILLA
jgi:hypothetical protein